MHSSNLLGGSSGDFLSARAEHDDNTFDVTAMVDVVSLMNIYFLITFVGAAMGLFDPPPASHCKALDPDKAIIFTVIRGRGETIELYVGDGKNGTPLTTPEDQEERITETVRSDLGGGKSDVLFKADKSIRLRDMRRLARAATMEGIALHFSVEERVN